MTLTFNKKQIYRELNRLKKINELTWKDIVKDRLDSNLKNYIKDVDTLIQTISNKNCITVLRRFL